MSVVVLAGCQSVFDEPSVEEILGSGAAHKGKPHYERSRAQAAAQFSEELNKGRPDSEIQGFVVRGTGERVGSSSLVEGLKENTNGTVSLNFEDADLRDVVRSVLVDSLSRNVLFDPAVEGKVTLQTSRPIKSIELVPLLRTMLQVNGAALIEDGLVFRVVPAENGALGKVSARKRNGEPTRHDGTGLTVVPLEFIGAKKLESLLRPFAPAGTIIQIESDRNVVLVGGPADEVATILELIDMFDVDWISGMYFQLYPLSAADPEAIVVEVQAAIGGSGPNQDSDALRLVPIPRLNSVLVIAANETLMGHARKWLERLDQGAEGDAPQLFIYFVEHGLASDLAEVLGRIFENDYGYAPMLAPGYEELNVTIDTAPPSSDETTGSTELETTRRSAWKGDEDDPSQSRPRIMADETRNALVIQATPNDYRSIQRAITQLDIAPLQVLLEATIAEVTLKDELKYGLQWFFKSGKFDFSLSEAIVGGANPIFPGFNAVFGDNNLDVVLSALDAITDLKVVSSPQLLVVDNQTGRIQVGDQVPVASQQALSTLDADARIVNQIETRDTGVILKVTPRVNQSGSMLLEIEQEVSRVTETITSGIDSPTINTRKINSVVVIQSGETVALGGLIQERHNDTSQGLPGLSRIPGIGAAFGTREDKTERTELLVLITPTVIRNREAAREMTEDLRSRLKSFEK